MQNQEYVPGTCGCGRSPTGNCIGWHGLSEDEFRQALAEYEVKLLEQRKNDASNS